MEGIRTTRGARTKKSRAQKAIGEEGKLLLATTEFKGMEEEKLLRLLMGSLKTSLETKPDLKIVLQNWKILKT